MASLVVMISASTVGIVTEVWHWLFQEIAPAAKMHTTPEVEQTVNVPP